MHTVNPTSRPVAGSKMPVGLVSPSTYNAATGRTNRGPSRLIMPLSWPVLTAFLNDDPDQDRYRYVSFDDITQDDMSDLYDVPVVLFTAYTGQIFRALELAETLRAKARRPQKFVLGGIHVTAIVKETVRARLIRLCAERGETLAGASGNGSRMQPLFRLAEAARRCVEESELRELFADPGLYLDRRLETHRLEDLLDSSEIPGPRYGEEFLALRKRFDVLFAGLLDAEPVGKTPVRDELRAEIESPEIRPRTILTLGFGDVNSMPRPNWNVCLAGGNARRFFPSPVSSAESGRPVPGLPYEAGRGCPYACDFCSVVNFFGPLRYRDVDLVYRDLLYGIEKLGAYEYFFVDDNINADMKRFRVLLQALRKVKEKHPMFGWAGQFSFRNIARHEEDMRAAREAGLRSCYLGLESVAEEALAGVNKGHNQREEIRAGIQILKRYDIVPYCNVITGLPADGEDFPEKMIHGLRDLDVPAILPFNLSPLPGTAFLNRLYREGNGDLDEIMAGGWKHDNSFDVVIGTDRLSRNELVRVRERFVEAYSSYDRIVDTVASYYRPLPLWLDIRRWLEVAGPFVQVTAMNLIIVRSLHEHRHYLACGPYEIDLRLFLDIVRDAARRRERGVGGRIRVGALRLLRFLAPVLARLFDRNGHVRAFSSSRARL